MLEPHRRKATSGVGMDRRGGIDRRAVTAVRTLRGEVAGVDSDGALADLLGHPSRDRSDGGPSVDVGMGLGTSADRRLLPLHLVLAASNQSTHRRTARSLLPTPRMEVSGTG